MSNIESEKNNICDISQNIVKNIRNLIDVIILELDMTMKKIEKNTQEMEDFEKIKVNIDKINNLIETNNINKNNDNFKIIKILEELNNNEIKNEELIQIAITIYKKNFIGIFKNNNFRINIVNRNFYEFILNKVKEKDLSERYKNRIIKLFIDDD
jgi:hypothetical protein